MASTPKKPSARSLAASLRSRRSWTRWRLRLTQRKLAKAQRHLLLLQLSLDSQHLLVKELELQQESLLHRQQEMAASQQFRTQGLPPAPQLLQLPEPLPMDPVTRLEMDTLLGLSGQSMRPASPTSSAR